MLGGGLEVVFVLAILRKAKKGEEKGRKPKVQKKRRDSMNQKHKLNKPKNANSVEAENLKHKNLKQSQSSYRMLWAADS